MEAKLQEKISEAKEQMAVKKAKLDEFEVELAEVQFAHSKMANSYSTDKCTAAILQQVSDKQPADAAAKVWDTLQGQITKVLASKQLDAGERSGIQSYVAEALLAAKTQLHNELEADLAEDDLEMDGGEDDTVDLQPADQDVPAARAQPVEPSLAAAHEDRGSPWAEPSDLFASFEQGEEHSDAPPSKQQRRAEGPYSK